MSEFKININEMSKVVPEQKSAVKELKQEMQKVNRIASSSALSSGSFQAIITSLKKVSNQLEDNTEAADKLNECLSETISLYKKAEKNICGKDDAKKKIKELIDDVSDFFDDLFNGEKYGENDKTCPMSEDPVNLATGNFIYEHTDIAVDGEIPLSFRRFYNAFDSRIGVLGTGFVHNYEISLEKAKDNENLILRMGDGQQKVFFEEDGKYVGQNGVLEKLEVVDGVYKLHTLDGTHYIFDELGKLVRQENSNGRGISFCYNTKTNLLEEAKNDNGYSLSYLYSNGKLVSVHNSDQKVVLSYKGDMLGEVILPEGNKLTYNYSEKGLINEIRNVKDTLLVKNHYTSNNQVYQQDFPDGSSMFFEYDNHTHRTTLVERNGSRITYVQDEKLRNTDIIYEDGTSEHFEYNSKNQITRKVDRNGNVCIYSYDNRGNITQEYYSSEVKYNYTYNSDNKLLCVTMNGIKILQNTYDKKGNLLQAVNADGTSSKMSYDENGRVICIEEDGNNIKHLFYDDFGNIVKIVDALQNETHYVYDEAGRVVETTDPNGNKTRYEYNSANLITCITNPIGAKKQYTYNEIGKVSEIIDFDGYVMKQTYNDLNKLESFTDKEGYETNYTYDSMWNLASQTNPDGTVLGYLYNQNNRLCETSINGEIQTQLEYDGNGNVISVIDPDGNKTCYTYDAHNHKTSEILADGSKTTYQYNSNGNLVKIIDPMGNEYTYTYDDMGRKTSATDPMGNVKKYTYLLGGLLAQVTYPNNTKETYDYDSLGRIISITKVDNSTIDISYDAVGNIIKETTSLGQSYDYQYDKLNRLIQRTDSAGGTRRYEYDKANNVIRKIDERNNETLYEYSPNGNLLKVKDALDNETRYEYDCMNRLCKIEQLGSLDNTKVTTYEWNKMGKVASMTDPLGNQEFYQYNKRGLLTEKIDRDGYHTAFLYDRVGNLTDVTFHDGKTVSYKYDALRHLKEVTDWIGKTTIEIDSIGRPLSINNPDGKTIHYQWGRELNPTDIIYPDGAVVHYEYDEMGRLKELLEGNNTTRYMYNTSGRLIEKILPNGIHTSYIYNSLGRVEKLMHEGSDISEGYSFGYDAAGNKIHTTRIVNGQIDSNNSFEYEYDALNQLTKVYQDEAILRSYTYDNFGNRIEKHDYSGENVTHTQYTYNKNNQLISEVDNDWLQNEKTYNYDRRGNLLAVMQSGQLVKKFDFDNTNQMRASYELTNNLVKMASYEYNGVGQRVSQTIYKPYVTSDNQNPDTFISVDSPIETDIHYTSDWTRKYNNLLQSCDRISGKIQDYFWDSNLLSVHEDEKNSFLLHDSLGSIVGTTNHKGVLENKYIYDEFGVSDDVLSDREQPFAFAGYQMDEVGGMYYAQARRYNAHLGRFISEDKISGFVIAPFTLNRYGYCWNRPLDFVDLDGRFPSGEDIQNWWNTNIYSEQYTDSTTSGGTAGIAYWGTTTSTTTSNDKYTGEVVQTNIVTEYNTTGGMNISSQYSINIPSYDAGNGNKFGLPISIGITVGEDGVAFDTNIGIDIGKFNYNYLSNQGFNSGDWVAQGSSYNVGWGDDSVGIDVSGGVNPGSNIKVGGHMTTKDGNVTTTGSAGLYIKTGYAYAIAFAAYLLCAMSMGMDPSIICQQYMNWMNNGVCPVLG